MESIQDREEKLGFHYKAENKGFPELLGTKLTYLILLAQVSNHKSLPDAWWDLSDTINKQQLVSLQRAFDDTSRRLDVGDPTIATPDILNMTLSLVF